MKRHILKSIHAEWLIKILNGEKTFEFWNKLPKNLKKGDIVDLYCTKGKPILWDIEVEEGIGFYGKRYLIRNNNLPMNEWIYTGRELNGLVVCQFTVGEIYDLHSEIGPHVHKNKEQGYTNQRYVIEITNLKVELRELSSYYKDYDIFDTDNNGQFVGEYFVFIEPLKKAPQWITYCYYSREVEK